MLFGGGEQGFAATNSVCANAAGILHSNVLPAYSVVMQYVKHQGREVRPVDSVLDIGAFEITSPFEKWRLEKFGTNATNNAIAADVADPDGDGVNNFLEYAFANDPLTPETTGWPREMIISTNGARYLAVTFTRRAAPSGVVYIVQTSSDLVNWIDGCRFSDTTNSFSAGETIEVSAADGTNKIVRASSPIDAAPAKYLRVQIENE